MAHEHSVYDGDTHFKIDPATRQIENTTGKVVLMQNDHNSERFTFEIPRYIDGHDMSLCNKVEVHYINIDVKDRSTNNGVYPVEDLQISPDSEDVVICSWLISQNATKYAGSLNFVLRYACLTDAVIDYQWFTDIHKGISVSESISNAEIVVEQYSDVLERWKKDLESLAADEAIESAVNAWMDANPIEHPETLPNPNALTLTGAVSATYDGSEAVSVEIPSGGGEEWRLINIFNITEEVSGITIDTDTDGNAFSLSEYFLMIDNSPAVSSSTNIFVRHNGSSLNQFARYDLFPSETNTTSHVRNYVHGERVGELWRFALRYNKETHSDAPPFEMNENVYSVYLFGGTFIAGRVRLYGR